MKNGRIGMMRPRGYNKKYAPSTPAIPPLPPLTATPEAAPLPDIASPAALPASRENTTQRAEGGAGIVRMGGGRTGGRRAGDVLEPVGAYVQKRSCTDSSNAAPRGSDAANAAVNSSRG